MGNLRGCIANMRQQKLLNESDIQAIEARRPQFTSDEAAVLDYLEELQIVRHSVVNDIREQAGLEPVPYEHIPPDEPPVDDDKPLTIPEMADLIETPEDIPKDNKALKAFIATELQVDVSEVTQPQMKEAQEMLEEVLVRLARQIVADARRSGDRVGGNPEVEAFNELLNLYDSQPSLNIRSSDSMADQAYSTPAPLAFLAARSAGVGNQTKVYEPTAGNGMLLITTSPENVIANEWASSRAAVLIKQGFEVTQVNATGALPKASGMDAVLANPPFGSLDKPTKVDGYTIKKIDHLIAANALSTLKDSGRATLILGAGLKAGEINNTDMIFFNWLYSHYNVVDHFEVDGKLYAGQGTSWPVRMVRINGRRKVVSSPGKVEADKVSPVSVDRLDNWRDIYERIDSTLEASVGDRIGAEDGADGPRSPDGGDLPGPAGGETTSDGPVVGGPGAPGGSVSGPGGSPPGERGGSTGGVGGDTGDGESDRLGGGAGGGGAGAGGVGAELPRPGPRTGDLGSDGQKSLARQGRDLSGLQVPYVAQSNAANEDIFAPSTLAGAMDQALIELDQKVNGIDDYVAEQLGYASVEAMHKGSGTWKGGLMGLQVDGIATAIYQMQRPERRAAIIADDTGVGKGRQVAGLLRWAKLQGKIPVFITAKPKLFEDIAEDFEDIGTPSIAPFMMNDGRTILGSHGTTGTVRDEMLENLRSGRLPDDRDMVFLTYSQIQRENRQREALRGIASNSIIVLDESHLAAGESATADFMINLLEDAHGVAYFSATFAKTAKSMAIYHRTDLIDAVESMQELIDSLAAGGNPVLEAYAAKLAESGQLVRRERDYDGIVITPEIIKEGREEQVELADNVTEGLRGLVDADHAFREVVRLLAAHLKQEGRAAKAAGSDASRTVYHHPFGAIVHNNIKQMLFALKAKSTADRVLKSIKAEEKPWVAFETTMGSFLDRHIAEQELLVGEEVDLTYTDILLKALERTRRLKYTDEKGFDTFEIFPLDELPRHVFDIYVRTQELIESIDFGDLPVSPLDYIRKRITDAGYTVKEITGRKKMIDYTAGTLEHVPAEERNDQGLTVREFNNGVIDVVLANAAGAAGLSAHASPAVGSDTRSRRMIVSQPAADIATAIQMFGRINRTGQIRKPIYSLLALDLPAEKRPLSVMLRKLKAMKASTTADEDSMVTIESPDMFNKYGDQVFMQYAIDNPGMFSRLEMKMPVVNRDEKGELIVDPGFALSVTGKLSLLTSAEQVEFYDQVEAAYLNEIAYRDESGTNELVSHDVDFQAISKNNIVIAPGRALVGMGGPAVLQTLDVKRQGKPPTFREVLIEGKKSFKEHGVANSAEMVEKVKARVGEGDEAHLEGLISILKAVEGMDKPYRRAQNMIVEFKNSRAVYQKKMDIFAPGTGHRINFLGDWMIGIVVDHSTTGAKKGNPYAPSKHVVTMMVNTGLNNGKVRIPLSKLMAAGMVGENIAPADLNKVFTEETNNEARIDRLVVTGNLLAGFAATSRFQGKVINFTWDNGTLEHGILLPQVAKIGDLRPHTTPMRDAEQIWMFLTENYSDTVLRGLGVGNIEDGVKLTGVQRGAASGIQISVPKSTSRGGVYHLQDSVLVGITGPFFSVADSMRATVMGKEDGVRAIEEVMERTTIEMSNRLKNLRYAPEVAEVREEDGTPKGSTDFSAGESANPDTDRIWRVFPQEFTSKDTSVNSVKMAAPFKLIDWKSGTINADIGGGPHDNAVEYLKGLGIDNVIFDPYNRKRQHNLEAVDKIRDGRADTATVNNVLNVIKERRVQSHVIEQAANALKATGTAYFHIYEGDGSGNPKASTKGWQENRKRDDYIADIEEHFGRVTTSKGMIVAQIPLDKERPPVPRRDVDASPVDAARVTNFAHQGAIRDRDPATTEIDESITEVVNPWQLVRRLEDHFGVKIRQGRLQAKNAAGTHDRSTGALRMQKLGAIKTAVHEVAHHMEEVMGPDMVALTQRFEKEVAAMSYDTTLEGERLLREGFAEFVKFFTLKRGYAELNAPGFYKAFVDYMLINYEEDLGMLYRLGDWYNDYRRAPTDLVALSYVVTTDKGPLYKRLWQGAKGGVVPVSEMIGGWAREAYTGVFMEQNPIRVAVNRLIKVYEKNHPGERLDLMKAGDAAVLMTLSIDAYGAAQNQILKGVIRHPNGRFAEGEEFTGLPEGHSFTDAVRHATTKQVSDLGQGTYKIMDREVLTYFDTYLISRRATHEWDRYEFNQIPFEPTEMNQADHDRHIADMEERFPQFIEAAEMLYEFQGNMWLKMFESGLITEHQYQSGLILHPDYVPLMRDRSDLTLLSNELGAGYNAKKGVIEKFLGSDRRIISPLESIMMNVFQAQKLIMKNDAKVALAELAEFVGHGSAKWMERIPDYQIKMTRLQISEITAALRSQTDWAGLSERELSVFQTVLEGLDDLDDAIGDQHLRFYRAGEISTNREPIVFLWRNGVREAWRLGDDKTTSDPSRSDRAFAVELYEALTGFNQTKVTGAWKLLRAYAVAQRFALTSHPTFQVVNMIRGDLAAWVLNPYYIPGVDFVRGLSSTIFYDEKKQRYLGAGGSMGGINVANMSDQRAIKDIQSAGRKGLDIRRVTLKEFMALTEFSESAMRMGIFGKMWTHAKEDGLTNWEALVEATYEARNIIDYGVHGKWMVIAQSIIPFLGAALRGAERYFRSAGAGGTLYLRDAYATLTGTEIPNDTRKEKMARHTARHMLWTSALLAVVSAIIVRLYDDDDEYDGLSDYLKYTHWNVKLPDGKWFSTPKPFQEAILANIVERSMEAAAHDDPKAWDRMWKGIFLTLFPPYAPPALLAPFEHARNKSIYSGMPIIPTNKLGVAAEEQFQPWTSTIARKMSKAMPEKYRMAPAIIDHYLLSITGQWGRDFISLTNEVDPKSPTLGFEEKFFTRRFFRKWTRGNVYSQDFYELLASGRGNLDVKLKTFNIYVDKKDDTEAIEYLRKMDDIQAGYVVASYLGSRGLGEFTQLNSFKAKKRKLVAYRPLPDHPIHRVEKLTVVLRDARDIAREAESLSPDQKRSLDDLIAERVAYEQLNTMSLIGLKGYHLRKEVDLSDNRAKMEAISPATVRAIDRLEEARNVRSWVEVKGLWPDLQRDLLEKRDAILSGEDGLAQEEGNLIDTEILNEGIDPAAYNVN